MFNKLKHIYQTLGYNLPVLIAFLLPFGINYAIFILIWATAFFVFDDVKSGIKNVFKNGWSYVLISFLLLHLICYFFSENKTEALNAIEIKLSFFAFPILIFSSDYNVIKIRKIVVSFVSGCLIACVFCLFRATYLYIFNDINAFFYSEFSYFMHPSYFAMYLIFAQLIVMLYYQKWLVHIQNLNTKIGFISVVFLVCIFLCASKMGLITASLLIPATLIVILWNYGYKKTIAALVAAFVISVFTAYKLFPTPFERVKIAFNVTSHSQNINKTDVESTAVRILIWEESVKIIKKNFWLGVTPGDANDELIKSYEREGMTGALSKRLNAHNQFLQTFIGTGVIGFVLLLLVTVGAFVFAIIKKNYLLVLFSILVSFNFLVESMLQAQAGFIFFVFFFCILTHYNLSKSLKNNPNS